MTWTRFVPDRPSDPRPIQIVFDLPPQADTVAVTDPDLMSHAIVVWTGWGHTSWPARDERRLVERYGDQVAAHLVVVLRALETEFYASDARHTVADLADMGAVAAARFQSIHPELSAAAVRALTWCYTYDF